MGRKKKDKIIFKVMLCPHCKTENKVKAHIKYYKIEDLEIKRIWALCPNCHQLFEEKEQMIWY